MSNLPEKQSKWNELTQVIFSEMEEWRTQHPKATFVEIETAIDQRLAKLRTKMLEDNSQSLAQNQKYPKCEKCGEVLHKRGKHTRHLITEKGERVEIEREYLVCPHCGFGLFPPR